MCRPTRPVGRCHTCYFTISLKICYAQARVQEFARGGGGPKSETFFFFFFLAFQFFRGGRPAQKLAEKMKFLTKKVAKYR